MRLTGHRAGFGTIMAVLAGSTIGAGVLAGALPASAAGPVSNPSPGTGYVEICKSYTPPRINEDATPTFNFTISAGRYWDGLAIPNASYDHQHGGWNVTVQAGSGTFSCSAPIPVQPGTVTITEQQDTWYQVSSIVQPPGESDIVPGSLNLGTGTVQVQVAAGYSATVQYTNDPVDGYAEVCKLTPAGAPLAGNFSYNLTGEDGYTGSVTAPLNGCSSSVEVPAGTLTVSEAGTNLYVTSISASFNADPSTNALVAPWPDLQEGTANVTVNAATSDSVQTDIYYTDNVVQFKLCKAFTGGSEPNGPSTLFPFALSSSGSAGPTAVPSSISLLAGTMAAPVCSNPVQLRAGTVVTVTEGVVPGSKAAGIVPNGALSVVPGSLDVVNRTIQVIVGQPVIGPPSNIVNEATVTYVDVPADPAPLKICVAAGSPAPSSASFRFTVSGAPGVTTSVAVGSCSFVGGAASPVLFPFNSTQTITGVGVSPDAATAIDVQPTNVMEMLVGVQATNEPSLVASALSVPQASVAMSEGGTAVTEVTFTISDPPAAPATPPSEPASTPAPTPQPASSPTVTAGSAQAGAPGTSAGTSSPAATAPSTTPTATPSERASASVVVSNRVSASANAQARLRSFDRAIATTNRSIHKFHSAAVRAARLHLRDRGHLAASVRRLEARLHALVLRRQQLLASW